MVVMIDDYTSDDGEMVHWAQMPLMFYIESSDEKCQQRPTRSFEVLSFYQHLADDMCMYIFFVHPSMSR
jgi:hypothetical protein